MKHTALFMRKNHSDEPPTDLSCADASDFDIKIDCNGVDLEMVKIKAGTFMMGSPEDEWGRYPDEKLHQVTLPQDYWLGKYQVTQAQWEAVMGDNPSRFNRHDFSVEQLIRWKGNRSFRNILDTPHFAKYQNCDNRPVEKVRWEEAKSFCDKLNEHYAGKLPCGYKFDLPTEAQWEYACRAGTMTALNNGRILMDGDICIDLVEVAWYNSCDDSENKKEKAQTHPVGQKRPNNWGLYDMHGNVWEWCRDWYGDYRDGAVTDPVGPRTGSYRVFRGGSWCDNAKNCRSAYRSIWVPRNLFNYLGFRLALVPEQ